MELALNYENPQYIKMVSDNAGETEKEQYRQYQQEVKKEQLADKAEQRKKEQREIEREARENKAYMSKKEVGNKVCKDGTMSLFLNITITGFVENVQNDNIQIRISDAEGTSPHYNGVTLYKNTIIWDKYSNWKKCR
jgi:hypothetical protein